MRWPIDVIAAPYRPLMEAQVVVELAGPLAEAIHRGEWRDTLAFATRHCGAAADRKRAKAVLDDLFRLTGRHHDERHFVERTLALLTKYWSAVEARADALIETGRVECERVERIIDLTRIVTPCPSGRGRD
jgi:hypothetical protein